MSKNRPQQRSRILIADDELSNHFLYKGILQEFYDLDFVINGQEVLAKISQQEYDVILLDILMPVLDGMATLKIIRQDADIASLPIIMISSLDDEASILEGLRNGANDYLTKPFNMHIMLARLATQVRNKQFFDERKETNAILEEANAIKSRMMQIAGHDLRNPLNNLNMVMNLLKASISDDDTLELIGIANKNVQTMSTIIVDFLSGENMFDATVALNMEKISPQPLLADVIVQNEIAARNKNISFIIESMDDALVFADGQRLEQVFQNLISNAIKYTPIDGKVYIRAYQTVSHWRLEVQDTGPGIPLEEQQYLFQAFSKDQISTQPTNNEPSTGLGLWIASEIMRLQNGLIGMESPDAGGSCFWLEISCATESQTHRQ